MANEQPPSGAASGPTTRRAILAAAPVLAVAAAQVANAQTPAPKPAESGPRQTRGKGPAKTMRALFAGGGGPPHFRSIEVPRIDSGVEAIVRPLTVALCDLDVPYIGNILPMEHPYAVGHEFTAEVVEVGDAVRTLKPGDRITIPFQISCGACARCRSARSLDCSSVEPLSTYGLEPFGGGARWGGAIADLVKVPFADAMALKLDPGIDLVAAAALSDNICDAYRSVVPHVRLGDEILVTGFASIGLYAVAFAKATATPCTYVDTDEARLKVAERLGAKVVSAAADGRSFGEFAVTVATSPLPGDIQSAIRSTAPGGICQDSTIHFRGAELPLVEMYKRGIRLLTSRANVRDDLPAVLDLIRKRRFNPADIGTSVIQVADAPTALKGKLPFKSVINMV